MSRKEFVDDDHQLTKTKITPLSGILPPSRFTCVGLVSTDWPSRVTLGVGVRSRYRTSDRTSGRPKMSPEKGKGVTLRPAEDHLGHFPSPTLPSEESRRPVRQGRRHGVSLQSKGRRRCTRSPSRRGVVSVGTERLTPESCPVRVPSPSASDRPTDRTEGYRHSGTPRPCQRTSTGVSARV